VPYHKNGTNKPVDSHSDSPSSDIARGEKYAMESLVHFKNVRDICHPTAGLLKDVKPGGGTLASGLLTRCASPSYRCWETSQTELIYL